MGVQVCMDTHLCAYMFVCVYIHVCMCIPGYLRNSKNRESSLLRYTPKFLSEVITTEGDLEDKR